jgi:hypothetical protein
MPDLNKLPPRRNSLQPPLLPYSIKCDAKFHRSLRDNRENFRQGRCRTANPTLFPSGQRLHRNSRLGLLALASHASPALDITQGQNHQDREDSKVQRRTTKKSLLPIALG